MVATTEYACVATKDTESISKDGVGVLRTMRLLVVPMPSAIMAFSAGYARTQTKVVDEMDVVFHFPQICLICVKVYYI
jgi:hypothetical protein